MASIAARVEIIGGDHDSGVARSSRAGTKRRVTARPAVRGCPGLNGAVPLNQTFRKPFLSSTVVSVAVVMVLNFAAVSALKVAMPLQF
jgi:hypothetical protein